MKDYYKNIPTSLTPKRAAAVHAIANRLCYIRDKFNKSTDTWTKVHLIDGKAVHTFWVGGVKSNSLLAEAVHEALPRVLKGKTITLVAYHKRRTVYTYNF